MSDYLTGFSVHECDTPPGNESLTEGNVMFDKLWELCGKYSPAGPQALLYYYLQSPHPLSPPLGFLYVPLYRPLLIGWCVDMNHTCWEEGKMNNGENNV